MSFEGFSVPFRSASNQHVAFVNDMERRAWCLFSCDKGTQLTKVHVVHNDWQKGFDCAWVYLGGSKEGMYRATDYTCLASGGEYHTH